MMLRSDHRSVTSGLAHFLGSNDERFRRRPRAARLCGRRIVVLLGVLVCALVIVTFSQFRASGATIASEGVFDCFPSDLKPSDGRALSCEASAVMTLDEDTLLIATDKNIAIPGFSQVFELPYVRNRDSSISFGNVSYRPLKAFQDVRKLEAFASTNNMRFAMSDFDWPPTQDSTEADPYNTFLFWSVRAPTDVRVAYRVERQGVVSSLPLREKFTRALADSQYPDGPPYFKIEGLAALPRDRLIFGVREVGESYEDFDFKYIVLVTKYEVRPNGLLFTEPVSKLLDFSTPVDLRESTGLSSIDYDFLTDRIYFLTSVEATGTLHGYLWMMSSDHLFESDKLPELVRKKDGSPLQFQHKPEGMTSIGKDLLFVVHDDDREETEVDTTTGVVTRKLHQSAYSVVDLR